MARKRAEWTWWNEHKCAKCGKVFIAALEHIYRDKGKSKWYCSWTCYNHRDDDKRKGEKS